MKAELLSSLFRLSTKVKGNSAISHQFNDKLAEIPKLNCLKVYLCYRKSEYRRWMNHAEKQVANQLDLSKFIKLKRMQWLSTLILIKQSQV